jgi:hypothetical protein
MGLEGKSALISALITPIIQFVVVAIANYTSGGNPDGRGCNNGIHTNIHNCSPYEAIELLLLQVFTFNIVSVGLFFFFIWLILFVVIFLKAKRNINESGQK